MRKRPLWNDFAVNERDGDISAVAHCEDCFWIEPPQYRSRKASSSCSFTNTWTMSCLATVLDQRLVGLWDFRQRSWDELHSNCASDCLRGGFHAPSLFVLSRMCRSGVSVCSAARASHLTFKFYSSRLRAVRLDRSDV